MLTSEQARAAGSARPVADDHWAPHLFGNMPRTLGEALLAKLDENPKYLEEQESFPTRVGVATGSAAPVAPSARTRVPDEESVRDV